MEAKNTDEFVSWGAMWAQFVRNVSPSKAEAFATSIGVTVEAINWLGIGWDGSKMAWVFREFDHEGNVVGLNCRSARSDGSDKGKKWMVTGSTRGLIYAPDPEWGTVPAYIDHPIPIPEGTTDVLACLSRHIYAIGRSSAAGSVESNAFLAKAVKDRDIALCVEYDKGAGMISTLEHAKRLVRVARSVRFLEPPEGAEDMREWFEISAEHAVDEIAFQFGRAPFEADQIRLMAGDVLTDTAPVDVAKCLASEVYHKSGRITLRRWMGKWMQWDGHAYRETEDEGVRADTYQFLDTKKVLEPPKTLDGEWKEKPYRPDRTKVNNVLDAAKSLDDIYLPPSFQMPCWLEKAGEMPEPHEMITFKNGILDLRTLIKEGRIRWLPKTPLLFSSNYCPHNFDPTNIGHAREFIEWLHSVVDDPKTVQLIREWLGYCITTDTRFEKFLFMYGRPSAGKGTCMDVMEAVIGLINIHQMKLESLGSRFGLYSALGKTNIFMPDTQAVNFERANIALEVIKTITGRGRVDLEGKNIQPISMKLPHRFTIASNTLPNFHDSASALRRRLLVAWFSQSFEDRMDVDLKARLTKPHVIEGVVAWAVEGYVQLVRSGGFTIPDKTEEIIRDFAQANNPIAEYISDCIVFEQGSRTPKDAVYASYSAWCKKNGIGRPMQQPKFKRNFPMTDPRIQPDKSGMNEFNMGRRDQIYANIRIKTVADD